MTAQGAGEEFMKADLEEEDGLTSDSTGSDGSDGEGDDDDDNLEESAEPYMLNAMALDHLQSLSDLEEEVRTMAIEPRDAEILTKSSKKKVAAAKKKKKKKKKKKEKSNFDNVFADMEAVFAATAKLVQRLAPLSDREHMALNKALRDVQRRGKGGAPQEDED